MKKLKQLQNSQCYHGRIYQHLPTENQLAFLESPEGDIWFRDQLEIFNLVQPHGPEISRQAEDRRIKSFVEIPSNVREWLLIKALLDDKIK